MIPTRLILTAAAAVLLASGCGSPACLDATAYLDSRSPPALRIPAGMSAPDRRGDMRVPGGPPAGGSTVKTADGRCLSAPPSYYATAGAANPDGLPFRPGEAPAAATPGPGAGPAAGTSLVSQSVAAFLARWADAWSARDPEAWFDFYAPDYAPAGYDSPADWQEAQRPRFEVPAVTTVEPETLEVETQDDGSARAKFVQSFGQPPEVRRVVKEVVLEPAPEAGEWKIVDERIVDIL